MLTSFVRNDDTAVFQYSDERPRSVFAIGDFNGWRSPGVPLHRVPGGWRGEYPGIAPGELSYKFVVDGHWVPDPDNVLRRPDGHGSENSILYHRAGKGAVFHYDFYSPAINMTRGYVIYLPPSYFYSDDYFNTIYLLHGALDWEYTWVHRGYVNKTSDILKQEGKIGDMILVMPRENGEFFRGDGKFSDYIHRDLVAHIEAEFKAFPEQGRRAIDGLSTGAFSSMVIGSSQPHIFSSVGALSGSFDNRVLDSFQYNLGSIRRHNLRFHITCGAGDPSCEVSGQLASTINSRGVECEFFANPGPHDWEFWGPAIAGNLQFHWWSFQR